MSSDASFANREQGGFTLIEILVAMVILAIGLLGLQGLGVVAARSVADAKWTTAATATATEYLERGLEEIRAHEANPLSRPNNRCVEVGENRVSVAIVMTEPRLPRVEVTVTPMSGSPASRVVTFSSHAFYDVPLSGPADGSPCP